LNTELNTAYTRVNELPGDCITAESVTTTQIDDGTIANADISSSAAIALSKIVSNSVTSSSSSTFSTSSATYVDVTNLTASITTTGRPVEIFLIGDSAQVAYLSASIGSGTQALGRVKLLRGATSVGEQEFLNTSPTGAIATSVPVSSIRFYETPAAGTYTYKLQALAGSASQAVSIYHAKLVVREL
jgi:hypothetical protein